MSDIVSKFEGNRVVNVEFVHEAEDGITRIKYLTGAIVCKRGSYMLFFPVIGKANPVEFSREKRPAGLVGLLEETKNRLPEDAVVLRNGLYRTKIELAISYLQNN